MFDKEHISLDEWMALLKEIAVTEYHYTEESLDSMDPEDWSCYYNDEYTPRDAMLEDASYGE